MDSHACRKYDCVERPVRIKRNCFALNYECSTLVLRNAILKIYLQSTDSCWKKYHDSIRFYASQDRGLQRLDVAKERSRRKRKRFSEKNCNFSRRLFHIVRGNSTSSIAADSIKLRAVSKHTFTTIAAIFSARIFEILRGSLCTNCAQNSIRTTRHGRRRRRKYTPSRYWSTYLWTTLARRSLCRNL